MEAKDTIMDALQISDVLWKEKCTLAHRGITLLAIAEAQADISFKAGYQQALEDIRTSKIQSDML